MKWPEISADALASKTSKLSRISIEIPDRVLGVSTTASIQSGLYYGYILAIEGLIKRLWDEIGFTCDVVATGGLASLYAQKSSLITKVEPFLTLYGLKTIWELNQG